VKQKQLLGSVLDSVRSPYPIGFRRLRANSNCERLSDRDQIKLEWYLSQVPDSFSRCADLQKCCGWSDPLGPIEAAKRSSHLEELLNGVRSDPKADLKIRQLTIAHA
jgi:hypothetical protein